MIDVEGRLQLIDRIGGRPISGRAAGRPPIRHLDPLLVLATAVVSAFGVAMIYATTSYDQSAAGLDPHDFLKRQLVSLGIGIAGLVAVGWFDYRRLRRLAPLLYVGTVVALGLVLTPVGAVENGARRWLELGAFRMQPSEFAKLALIVVLAAYLAGRKGDIRVRDLAMALSIVGLPAVLIFMEPDVGTMLVVSSVAGASLLLGGTKPRYLLVLAALAVVAAIAVVQGGLLRDYQMQRLTAFLDPSPPVRSYGYSLIQSKIAIGSGGLAGRGFGTADTQTALDFVPEQHTDFIFTAVGEQLGFVGSAVVLAAFALLVWRAIRIAIMAGDALGTLIAGCIAALWALQIFVNVGMTMGIMPITGIPLPFVSYGGSSLITNYLAAGLLLNIHMRRLS